MLGILLWDTVLGHIGSTKILDFLGSFLHRTVFETLTLQKPGPPAPFGARRSPMGAHISCLEQADVTKLVTLEEVDAQLASLAQIGRFFWGGGGRELL